MKLTEIFGSPSDVVKRKVLKPAFADNRKAMNDKRIGAGAYGYALQHPTQPGDIVKRNFQATFLKNDAYYQYVKYVFSHNLAEDNIHFPRIYKIELTEAGQQIHDFGPQMHLSPEVLGKVVNIKRTGQEFYRVDMEALTPGKELEPEEISLVTEQLFDVEGVRRVAGHLIPWLPSESTLSERLNLLSQMLTVTARKMSQMEKLVKDESLWEALKVIGKIRKTNTKFDFDLHYGNFMFRRLGTGAQLVFTDPLA